MVIVSNYLLKFMTMPKIKRNLAAEKVADLIIENYKPQNSQDVQEALNDDEFLDITITQRLKLKIKLIIKL